MRQKFLLLMAILLTAHCAWATNYVTFNNGRLIVFPDSCVKTFVTNDGRLTVAAIDDKVYKYSLDDIASIDQQLNKALPTITSYKYNNKYNYQVFTDAVGVISDNEINVTVAGIGKRLTASFNLSDENAKAYVDGVEQISKKSRLRFDRSRTYTVGYKGDQILLPDGNGHYGFMPFGREYAVHVDFLTDHSTAVPRIEINTVNGEDITSKKFYLDAEIIIDGSGVFPSYRGVSPYGTYSSVSRMVWSSFSQVTVYFCSVWLNWAV